MNLITKIKSATFAIFAGATFALQVSAEILPLDAFAMMPVIRSIGVSPNGEKLAMVRATHKEGGYILEIYDTDDLAKRPVRIGAEKMEMTSFNWLNDKRLIVDFRQVLEDANERGWVGKSAIVNANAKGKWLEFPDGATLLALMRKDEDHILLSYDDNDNNIPDAVKFNVKTGRTTLMVRGSEKMGGFIVDPDGVVRGAQSFDLATSSIESYARVKDGGDWKLIKTVNPSEDREDFDFLGFNIDNPSEVYVRTNKGQDKSGIYALNIETGEYSDRLFGLKSIDAGSVIQSGKLKSLGALLGFSYTSDEYKRYFTDPVEGALFKAISDLFPGRNISLASRSEDDNAIVVQTWGAKDPGSFYLIRDKSKLEFLSATYPLLTEDKLADVEFIKFKARDGLSIPAYITKPKGAGPFPAIILPHGGPWARDSGGYDEWAQLLAHHGYIVMQPEFRGSQGFGLAHWKAGDKEWGLKMQDDVDDAAQYLVQAGLATPDKLALFGWSYGGYSAFAGSMRENNIFQCSVAGAGVSDLSLINAGLHDNPFLRKLQRPTIKGVSPIEHVDKVNIPILVVHGNIDERVDVVHSRKFVDKLVKFGKPHKYLEIDGLDHFSSRFSYDHKTQFYTELLNWFSNTCFK